MGYYYRAIHLINLMKCYNKIKNGFRIISCLHNIA